MAVSLLMYLPIVYNSTAVDQLPVYPEMAITSELMGSKEIKADIQLPGVLISPIGSAIQFKGEPYTVNTPPLTVTKRGDRLFEYSVMFESVLYTLYDKKLQHLGNKTFQYYGAPLDLANLIVSNINEIDPGWTVGVCDPLPEKTINFDGHTCRTALNVAAEAHGIEWFLDGVGGKRINFVKQVGTVTGLEFQYGMGKGLYSLSYSYQSDKNIVTRATGYGSSRNLPKGYRNGATQLKFEGNYLEQNVYKADGITKLYGVKEGEYENKDIYPQINGFVSGVSAFNPDSGIFTITDATLNFDLNAYFSSETPKLSFKTGELQGQEFEITGYVHATKTITAKVFVDSSNNPLPRLAFQAHVGDTYDLFDMYLPDEAVRDAENRLRIATQAYLAENCIPRVKYTLELDPLFARANGIMLKPGDQVRIIDASLGINEMIRVTKTVYNINFPDELTKQTKIVVEIANFIPYTITERVIAGTIDNQQAIKVVDRRGQETAKRGAANLRVLAESVFDVEGNFDSSKFNVGVLQAMLGIFGLQSANFLLNKVFITANFGGDPNAVNISAGELFHLEYSNPGNQNIWQMQEVTQSGLIPGTKYYVYSKLSKSMQAGSFLITTDQVRPDDIPGFYTIRTGLIYPQINGLRDVDFTYGITTVNGRQIKAGVIQGNTGALIINLDTGEIFGRLTFRGSDGVVKDVVAVDNLATTAQANALTAQSAAESAHSFADSISQSRANAAQAAAQSNAANDAQARADAAYNSAVGASNEYAATVANSAASAAQIAAAADASSKATAAFNSAQAAADAKYNALTAALKPLAFRDIQLAANQGVTIIDNGSVLTFLVDAAYIRANVITVGYISGMSFDFTSGTIGGIAINAGSISAPNFQLTAGGVLTASNATISGTITALAGTIGGFSLSQGYMQGTNGDVMGGRFALNPSGGYIAFVNDSTGSFAGIGSNVISAAAGTKVLARFSNVESNTGGSNIAMMANAVGASDNIAIDIPNGGIRVAGTKGFTGYQAAGGSGTNLFDKYREGIYLGRGNGNW
jgi:hypothetical protein